jgi:NAD-dependent dihydropyrimidine dehydrogenase PreA subunit
VQPSEVQTMLRDVVMINEELCDGCGQCIPACHEGALRIVGGKARLVSDVLCDGMGACLGHCPRGAIRVERREAAAFDEAEVARTAAPTGAKPTCPTAKAPTGAKAHGGGCPGSRFAQFDRAAEAHKPAPHEAAASGSRQPSALEHWPVQLNLLSPAAPVLRGARLLVAADCVPVACGEFHERLLRGRAVVIGCPKFDDVAGYAEKLAEMIARNNLSEIVVARMEVPCCGGIVAAVLAARRQAGVNVRVTEVVVSTRGEIIREAEWPPESAA